MSLFLFSISIDSRLFDDSPISDNNIMDISEQTTLSQESFGLSPETEHRMNDSAVASDTNGSSDSDTTSKPIGSKIGKSAATAAAAIAKTTTTTTISADADDDDGIATAVAANAAAAAATAERKMATTNSSLSNVTSRTSNRNANSNSNSNEHDNKFDDSSLDNRILVNKNTIANSKQRIGMTLVDMHPLMINDNEDDDDDDDDDDVDDLTPDSSAALDAAGNQDSGFHHSSDRGDGSPMHVSPMQQRFDTLCLPAGKKGGHHEKYMSSGESDAEVSQCQASVEPTFQSVALTNYSNTGKLSSAGGSSNNRGVGVPKASSGSLRKIPLTAELMVTAKEDDSSIETISNNSFDNDIEADGIDDDDDDVDDDDGANNGLSFMECKSNRHPASNESILNNSVSATINSENGIRLVSQAAGGGGGSSGIVVTLPNGQTRDIDMKVIEPYKRCLSHGGYIKSPGHNAIVIFSACYLPDRSRADYHYVMENLFL